ncbi:hypothetical protein AVEN_21655-1 [Araneus ventricosus]|uniref:Uncharacterized protein n=1 Tax=Araneus ventricosus TaxID=182803 RepID=A0A4Y2TWR3_ARAVE|nr:hypothetical protein AVEN_21655-1 [Araneus ventricosus]
MRLHRPAQMLLSRLYFEFFSQWSAETNRSLSAEWANSTVTPPLSILHGRKPGNVLYQRPIVLIYPFYLSLRVSFYCFDVKVKQGDDEGTFHHGSCFASRHEGNLSLSLSGRISSVITQTGPRILDHGQMTTTTPELPPPSLTSAPPAKTFSPPTYDLACNRSNAAEGSLGESGFPEPGQGRDPTTEATTDCD